MKGAMVLVVMGLVLQLSAQWEEGDATGLQGGVVSVNARPFSTESQALYPDWAHDHWVWLHTSISTQANVLDMVNGYLSRNIKVGAIDIDSSWSTGVNNFIFDTKKFPNATDLVSHLHSLNIRVILWATTMIDVDSSNYQEGLKNNYYLNDGATVHWWHGDGSFIDYTNPAALDWWHKQMDLVLDIGIDGWKCDGTDPFVFELVIPRGYGGIITEREYADYYYRDFYYYSQKKNPDALIMSRPVDSFDNILYLRFSPRDVVFSGWVGDQDPTFSGLQDALDNIFQSAFDNYVNFGSDIGGYRSGTVRTQEVFLRWAQLGAFLPLMENGGGGPHFPWQFDNSTSTITTDIYRDFVNIHYSLKPYFLSAGTAAYQAGTSVLFPIASVLLPDHSWDYMLWKDIFVAPIIESGLQRTIEFPSNNNWIYWFNSSHVYQGGSSVTLNVPLDQYPVFHRAGSMIPLVDDRFPDKLVVSIFPVKGHEEAFVVRRWKKESTELCYSWKDNVLHFTASASHQGIVVVLSGIVAHPLKIVDNVYEREIPLSRSYQFMDQSEIYFFNSQKQELHILFGQHTLHGVDIQIHKLKSIY